MRIFHVATAADWQQARAVGSYRTSTYGRSLTRERFIHACRREQLAQVLRRRYADISDPLVLLEIETDLLDVPWREEMTDSDLFPRIYGPLPTRAVVAWRPARPSDGAVGHSAPPLPALTRAFLGAATVLGCVTVTFLVLLLVAHTKVQDGELAPSTTFLMWAFLATSAVSTGACLTVGGYLRQTDSAGAAASRVPSHG